MFCKMIAINYNAAACAIELNMTLSELCFPFGFPPTEVSEQQNIIRLGGVAIP